MDYEVYQPGANKERQIYYIHLLKLWQDSEGLSVMLDPEQEEFGKTVESFGSRWPIMEEAPFGSQLEESQRGQLKQSKIL